MNLDQLVNFIPKLLKNKKYGTYNIGSKSCSYSSRIKKIGYLNNISYKKNLIEIKGFVKPVEMKLNTKKNFEKFEI